MDNNNDFSRDNRTQHEHFDDDFRYKCQCIMHAHIHIHKYIYIYMGVCTLVCKSVKYNGAEADATVAIIDFYGTAFVVKNVKGYKSATGTTSLHSVFFHISRFIGPFIYAVNMLCLVIFPTGIGRVLVAAYPRSLQQ